MTEVIIDFLLCAGYGSHVYLFTGVLKTIVIIIIIVIMSPPTMSYCFSTVTLI